MDFDQLVKEHHPLFCKICRVYAPLEDFDDLYQEMLISIWQSFKSFKAEAKLSTWLYRVCLNTALTYSRKKKKNTLNLSPNRATEIPAPESNEALEREAKINNLYTALQQLNKPDRTLLFLFLQEKKYQEIAEITGISSAHVGVKLARAKKKLKTHLNDLSHE